MRARSTRRPPRESSPFHQQVALVETLDELAKGLAGHGDAVVDPALQREVVGHASRVVHLLVERDVLFDQVGDGVHEEKAGLEKPGWTVAVGVDHRVDVEVAGIGPEIEKRVVPEEIDGRSQQGERSDQLGPQRGEEGGHGSAHAVAEQMYAVARLSLADPLDRPLEKSADVVLEGQPAVGVRGDAPVDEIDVEALLQVLLDDALVRLQVEDVGAVDQRVTEQHRLAVSRPASPAGSAAACGSPP